MPYKTKKDSSLSAFLLLAVLIFLIYARTIDYPWQLDDYHNITQNPSIQITSLDISTLLDSLFAAPSTESLSRPIAFLSFSLNWYLGQDNSAGYRLVNIIIHFLTALFLFLSVQLLFRSPALKNRWDSGSVYFIALLTATLWAVHPIQIQAVTYIVQRMASLAALFYLIGIFSYLKARMSSEKTRLTLFLAFCVVSFFLAVGSKQNAVLLPVSIFLLEFIFFQDLSQKRTQKFAIWTILMSILLVGVSGFFLFADGSLDRILNGYEKRTFSLLERVLTQPSIVLFYLSQIFYPIASRFSITHDFTVSSSLFSPWYTLPSILIVLGLIGFALWRIKRNPVLSFAILFYFGNHAIESSIIPLELVFEHRNYLPSLFLFLPVSIGVLKLFSYYRSKHKIMHGFLVLTVCCIIACLGLTTYVRNWDWRSVKAIWADAMEKAPRSARPVQNLAWAHYEQTGQIEKAIAFYKRATTLEDNKKNFRFYSYNNLANIYFSQRQDHQKALFFARNALKLVPNKISTNVLYCKILAKTGNYDEAISHLNTLMEQDPYISDYPYIKGFLLLKKKKPEKAFTFFKKSLDLSPDRWAYLKGIGLCLTHMGNFQRGYWFLNRALTFKPQNTDIIIGLVDNRLLAGSQTQAEKWVKTFVDMVGVLKVEHTLKAMKNDPTGTPFSDQLGLLVSKELKKHAKKYENRALELQRHFEPAK